MIEKETKFDILDKGHIIVKDWMGHDFKAEETARISTGADADKNRTPEQRTVLTRYLLRHWHSSCFEFCNVDLEIKAPIMVIRQWHRHRTQCLTGDTELYFDLPLTNSTRKGRRIYKKTIKELFDSIQYKNNGKRKRSKRSWSDYRKDVIGKMKLRCLNEQTQEFVSTNITDIYPTGIQDVYEIEFENGYKIKSTLNHRYFTDQGWQTLEEAVNFNQNDNGNFTFKNTTLFASNGVPCYKNKEWLKDKRKKKWKVQQMADAANCSYHTIRKWLKIHDLKFTAKEKVYFSAKTQKGQCRSSTRSCHFVKVKNIKHLGQEETYDISVSGPYHNFVANGIVVHNSYNEESGRYKKLDPDYYVPKVDRLKPQSKGNHQGTDFDANFDDFDPNYAYNEILNSQETAEEQYKTFIDEGMANEISRINMPVSHYSTFRANASLLNWYKFCLLREDSHAQWEIREYAKVIHSILGELFPECTRAYEDYWLNSVSFSAREKGHLKDIISSSEWYTKNKTDLDGHSHFTKREWLEFKDKINRILDE